MLRGVYYRDKANDGDYSPMNNASESGDLYPFDAPLHFSVEDLRVFGHLNLDAEEGYHEPPFEFAVAGLAALDI